MTSGTEVERATRPSADRDATPRTKRRPVAAVLTTT